MSDQDTFTLYFEDAMKIHAICADHNYSEEMARVLTYMHSKGCETGRGIEYFYDPAPEDREALEIMLGEKRSIQLPSVAALDEDEHDAVELILSIAGKIAHLDGVLARECGLENRLSGELRLRLKLYKCPHYRDHMVDLYRQNIRPNLQSYDRERIDTAFKRYHSEKDRMEKELMDMAGIKVE
ncbi:hypothetical protein QA601_12965 [Chitinispirillales bacterium ANBcel5]|uniref:hypothetical protein n=1 Tax=Cellulosispirillum alkaliphilum TaxID=3039283 RepID=UPI002A545545|nr:hypothetical protein [Chitinispirillales bacterium ANBcel5]